MKRRDFITRTSAALGSVALRGEKKRKKRGKKNRKVEAAFFARTYIMVFIAWPHSRQREERKKKKKKGKEK